jgi:hypothetical protein
MVRLLSSLLYILWVNIASVDGSRVAAAVVLPPSRVRWTLRGNALRAISLCYISMHLCISLLAHGLLPCSPVVRASVAGDEIMSMFSGVKVATLCLFDFAKLQQELMNCHVKSH